MQIKTTLFVLFLAWGTVLAQEGGGAPKEDVSLVVVSPAVEIGELESRRFPGHIIAVEEVNVIARVTGYIEKINFREGDYVNAGDLLFEIEQREYAANAKKANADVSSRRSQILQNEAAIKEQEARIVELDALIRYRELTFKRNQELYQQKAVSEDDVDSIESSLKATRAQRDAAVAMLEAGRAQLESGKAALAAAEGIADLALFDMEHTRIKAPIAGKIGKVTVTQGNLITPQFGTLVDIKSISPIYVRFAISERLFRSTYGGEKKIKELGRIRLELADDTIYPEEAVITMVDNKIDRSTNTIMLWARLKNEDHSILPGSYATVHLSPKSNKPGCGVLLSALQTDDTGSFVYVLDKGSKIVRRDVVPGVISDQYYEIKSGVVPGEIVVVDGMNKVKPGQTVETVPYKSDKE
ncbi:MAG: efflux RND transporter periplasmic adaptor subunit [Thermoguttaceae bacterium]|nr:efflux RND transporter periplasmic adaptor subunit [Thermoguttaceae bacterium]